MTEKENAPYCNLVVSIFVQGLLDAGGQQQKDSWNELAKGDLLLTAAHVREQICGNLTMVHAPELRT